MLAKFLTELANYQEQATKCPNCTVLSKVADGCWPQHILYIDNGLCNIQTLGGRGKLGLEPTLRSKILNESKRKNCEA